MTPTIESVWQEFSGRLAQFIGSRVADAAAADDLLQDVFLKIASRVSQVNDRGKLQGWVYRIARNAIIDHYRTRKETVELPETLAAEPASEDAGMEGLVDAFRRMIDALPNPYREAVKLTELEGLTQRELANRLGLSLSGAKSRVHRGREQLKQMLLDCCRFEFDRRGRIIDCIPRSAQACPECPKCSE
jgi:RNA polymerase sigma-70 factor (ECF subfamily)